ncbi:MAG: hypothetical protein COB17_11495 [Sulfurimonas sp.]|nr:MAG: hypothetical protein COB17_11495 [Sulfurimonas sp.]
MTNDEIIKNLVAPSSKECLNFTRADKKEPSNHYKLNENISPYNLFLYLFTRFGKPNGILSLLRKEDSDQLFHWHYSLYIDKYNIEIMCATYKIEVFASTELIFDKDECLSFLQDCIKDIKNYATQAKEKKKSIENWEMIINPFARIQKQINLLLNEIEHLNEELPDFNHSHIDEDFDSETFNKWSNLIEEISAKVFAVKCLTPVYIETFINFIIKILCKEEFKNSQEKYNTMIRENINIKIKSLHKNCIGFRNKIDKEDIVFKKIYTIFNHRNDLLHGNFNIKQLKYGEVGFIKKMPLFKKISSFQEEMLTTAMSSGNLNEILQNIDDVQMFFRYILLDLDDNIRKQVVMLLESYSLGWNPNENKFSILFTNHYVDFKVS